VQDVSYTHYVDTADTTCLVSMMRLQHGQFRKQAPEVRGGVGHLRSVLGERRNGCHPDKAGRNNDPGVGGILRGATKRFD